MRHSGGSYGKVHHSTSYRSSNVPGGPPSPPAFKSFGSGSTTSGASIAVTAPSGIVAGDLLIMFIGCQAAANPVTSTGFTSRSTLHATHDLTLLTKVATNSEPGSYTVNFSGTVFGSGLVLRYGGASDIEGVTSNSNSNASAANYTLATLTPSGLSRVWLGLLCSTTTSSPVAPASFNTRASFTPAGTLHLFAYDINLANANPTGTISASLGTTTGYSTFDTLPKP